MNKRIRDIINYKTYAELKAEAQRYYLGVLWWLIEPVFYMLVFYFVFAVLFRRGTENFVVSCSLAWCSGNGSSPR